MSKFGYFSENGSEYTINTPNTPRPQINYIWNDLILSGVNHFGGGVGAYGGRTITYIDPEGKGRSSIVKNGNRFFYIKDMDSNEIWSPGWFPVRNELDRYSCTHGLGYSIFESSKNNIESKLRVFVNNNDPVEIWTIALKNNSSENRHLNVYSFVEFILSGYPVYCNYYATVYAKNDEKRNMVIAYNEAQERHHDWYNGFIASSMEISGFETSYNAFFANYTDISAPHTVKEGKCTNSIAVGEDMVGVLENKIVLKPGEEISFNVLIGATGLLGQEQQIVDKLFVPGKIDADFDALLKKKNKMTEDIKINTPDNKVNFLINHWVKQQIQLCAEVGRDVGKGFRDQLQDAWAIASFNSSLAKDKILETLRYQNKDGSCVRGWLPIDPHIYSDGPVWIPPAVNAYLKETGDYSFLDISVPFLDEGSATVWEHILISVRYSSDDIGERNLVLAHEGDWNDSLNGIGVKGKGESVWTSIALFYALNEAADIAANIKEAPEIAEEMRKRAERIKKEINLAGWDGEWYLAGYDDDGRKVGTHKEKEGSIYLNSQTWAVMTGVAEDGRIMQCLKVVDEKLDSPYGPLTLYPTYTKYNPSIGRLTSFVPGIWENGTPYCHGGTFKIVADCCAGRGNKAYETLIKIMPDSDLNPSDYSGCEPYALTNMYFGPDNPKAGKTLFAWVTGTAGWIFRSVTQYIMGFYPGFNEIEIKPCIPDFWEECSIKRVYRGDVYNIVINNKNKGQTKVSKITVDGEVITGNRIPIYGDGKEHNICVEMA
jgi:cellobiose phosphorylase